MKHNLSLLSRRYENLICNKQNHYRYVTSLYFQWDKIHKYTNMFDISLISIYINHFNLEILPNLMNLLKENLIKTETYVQVYSIDGIYKIDSLTTKKLIAVDNNIEILNDFYNNYTLIVDKSYMVKDSNDQYLDNCDLSTINL